MTIKMLLNFLKLTLPVSISLTSPYRHSVNRVSIHFIDKASLRALRSRKSLGEKRN